MINQAVTCCDRSRSVCGAEVTCEPALASSRSVSTNWKRFWPKQWQRIHCRTPSTSPKMDCDRRLIGFAPIRSRMDTASASPTCRGRVKIIERMNRQVVQTGCQPLETIVPYTGRLAKMIPSILIQC